MPKRLLFAHSAGPQGPHEGSRELFARLEEALGADYELRYPEVAEPDRPQYAHWQDLLARELAAVAGDEVVLVGHSLGGSVLLKYLSEHRVTATITAMHLIATPFWSERGWSVDEFVLRPDAASKLPRIPRTFLYHSRDDEGVPFSHLSRYAALLPHATLRELDGYGHLFDRSCPPLIDDLRGSAHS